MSQRSTKKGSFWSNNPYYWWYISAWNGEHTCSAPSMENSTFAASECGSAGCAEAIAVFICDVEKLHFVLCSYHLQSRAGQEANVLSGLHSPF